MGRVICAVVLLWSAAAASAQRRGAVDWIFLVDTSKSMVQNRVFDPVKRSLGTFVDEAGERDSIAILTFDRDVELKAFADVDKLARNDLRDAVQRLEAKGLRTHLGLAIARGLDRAESRRTAGDRTQAIVLFTDGKEDAKGIENPVPISSTVQRALASGAYIFFVSLHEHEPQLRAFPNAQFLEATDEAAIRSAMNAIRKTIAPPVITVSPPALTFGDLKRGQTAEREITIVSNKPARATVTLQPADGVSMPQHKSVQLPAKLRLQLTVAADAKPGPRQLTIDVTRAQPIAATVTILEPPLLARLAKWLILGALVLLAAIIAVVQNRKRNRLEGEIEIVKPRVQTAFVGLPALQASEVALSAIVPPDALGGSDARLFIRRQSGVKTVWIAAQNGPLRVNDVEVPASELYDADTIQIGDAKLRFNHVGHQRPQEDQP